MSQTLPNERDQRLVEDAVENPQGVSARLILLIGDEDYSNALDEGEWGQTEIPYSLDATLGSVLPRRLENEEVRLSVEIAGVVVPGMVGYLSTSEVGEDLVSTDILSASAGALFSGQNSVKIGEELAFSDTAPEYVVQDAVYRLPYDKSAVSIDRLLKPLLSYASDEGFRPEEEAGAILSRVGELELYLFRDTADGGFRAARKVPLARREPRKTYLASDMPDWRPPPRAELYYSDVIVFSEERRFDPVRAGVEYPQLTRPPFARQTRYIPLPNSEEADAGESAAQIAFDEAERLSNLTHRSEVTLPAFDPLYESGDVFTVEEIFKDDDGTWAREWLAEVESFRHPFGDSLETIVNYAGMITEEEMIRAPSLILPPLPEGLLRAIYGRDGDELYFGASLAWVRADDDEIVFTETEGLVQIDDDEVVISR